MQWIRIDQQTLWPVQSVERRLNRRYDVLMSKQLLLYEGDEANWCENRQPYTSVESLQTTGHTSFVEMGLS